LLAMMANTGVIECYGIDPGFKAIGAKAMDKPDYRGGAYVAEGSGTAKVVKWSPNHAVVEVEGGSPGALVVYNMNWDPSCPTNGAVAAKHDNAVSARLPAGATRVEFRYFPRSFAWSLPI